MVKLLTKYRFVTHISGQRSYKFLKWHFKILQQAYILYIQHILNTKHYILVEIDTVPAWTLHILIRTNMKQGQKWKYKCRIRLSISQSHTFSGLLYQINQNVAPFSHQYTPIYNLNPISKNTMQYYNHSKFKTLN